MGPQSAVQYVAQTKTWHFLFQTQPLNNFLCFSLASIPGCTSSVLWLCDKIMTCWTGNFLCVCLVAFIFFDDGIFDDFRQLSCQCLECLDGHPSITWLEIGNSKPFYAVISSFKRQLSSNKHLIKKSKSSNFFSINIFYSCKFISVSVIVPRIRVVGVFFCFIIYFPYEIF